MIDKTQEEIMAGWYQCDGPVVSVCCLTYNHENYIEQSLDGILMQETKFPFEIIVHDDASTDRTPEILNQYAIHYPRIVRLILQDENQFSKAGLIAPRFVFPKARGKYIALCEGDDFWVDKYKLDKQVSFLEENLSYVITYSDSKPFNDEGYLDIDFGGARRNLEAIELKKATPIFTLTACFRNVIKDIPSDLLCARYGDLVIWSLLGAYGKGKYMPEILPSAYRVHDRGIHSKKTKKQRHRMSMITKAALFSYYSRRKETEVAEYFLREVLRESLLGLGAGEVFRYLSGRLIRKVGRLFYKLKPGVG